MSNTILLGIDGSDCCGRAADLAAQHAKATGARLVTAYVIEWSPYTFNTPEENEQRHKKREEEIERATTHVIKPAVEQLRQHGIEVEGMVRHGHAAQVLAQIAKETGAKQIYVGRTGHSSLRDLLFGSVVSSLVQIAPVPVTVVP